MRTGILAEVAYVYSSFVRLNGVCKNFHMTGVRFNFTFVIRGELILTTLTGGGRKQKEHSFTIRFKLPKLIAHTDGISLTNDATMITADH